MVTDYRVSLEDLNVKTHVYSRINSTLNGHTLGYLSEDFKVRITLHNTEKKNTKQVNVLFKSFQLYGYTHLVYAQIKNIQLNILR